MSDDQSLVDERMKKHMRALMNELRSTENPFVDEVVTHLTERRVASGVEEVAAIRTGEHRGVKSVYELREVDEQTFVKDFDREINSAFELTTTAKRVLNAVRDEYRSIKLRPGESLAGNADQIYLKFMDGGLCGQDIGMSEKTFKRGMKELVAKNILAPFTGDIFWLNPTVFFRGDRIRWVKEWRIKQAAKSVSTGNAGRADGSTDELLPPDQQDLELE